MSEFLRYIHLYDETVEVARRLRQLALTYGLHGKRLHDANIVATMSIHGIHALVTQNPGDFAPFDEIDSRDSRRQSPSERPTERNCISATLLVGFPIRVECR